MNADRETKALHARCNLIGRSIQQYADTRPKKEKKYLESRKILLSWIIGKNITQWGMKL